MFGLHLYVISLFGEKCGLEFKLTIKRVLAVFLIV